MKKVITSSSTLLSCLIAMVMMLASQSAWAEYVPLTALSGTGGTGSEGFASLVDQKENTKMGHSYDQNNPDRPAWIVVKAEKAVVPEFYFLVTGNDTGNYTDRNWKAWNIYGGNFASDAEAVRGDVANPEAGGWTLIDERSGETLPQKNMEHVDMMFNNADGTTAYQYFWIEILESVNGGDIWLQMGEWGLGTYGDFEDFLSQIPEPQTGTDEPIQYTIISGDRNDGSGEGLDKLFDGDIGTKWGNGFSPKAFGATSGGAYFIVKTSREIAPTYYKLVTGTDNASWRHRNWNTWQVYAMAEADVPEDGKPTRASDKWVMLDRKDNVPEEILPDKNMFTVFMEVSESNTTAYKYFKVEIDKNMGDGYMQMGEFALGDEYTLVLDRTTLAESIDYDPDMFAEKALVDQMGGYVDAISTCTSPSQLNTLNSAVSDLSGTLDASANSYAELIAVRNKAVNLLAEGNLTEEATEYATAWIDVDNAIAPNDEYPAGNFGYIKANRQLTGAEAAAEAARFSNYLTDNLTVIDEPIGVDENGELIPGFYTALDGSGGFGGEEHDKLIDGDKQATKWCSNSLPGWMVFKSAEPIRPTYYGLVTGGDTQDYKDRNWKSWKIYAANFDSDEEATPESEKWVLIDEKNNVGEDVLKTTNVYESYINLSIGCAEPYQYFMIKDVYAWGGLMQMNEFTFYNQGNLVLYRDGFLEKFADYDPEERPAYPGYVQDYKDAYAILQNSTNAPDVMKAYNSLSDMQAQLDKSADLYEDYQVAVEDLSYLSFDSESMNAWYEGYTSENEGPNNLYVRGTYEYIMDTYYLDNEGIHAEIAYLNNIQGAVNDGLYILLGGHTEGEWGDGYYGQLINVNKDGLLEGGDSQKEVKWGGQADANGNTYIIFRTLDKTNPFFYTLTTGNDTQANWGRNWGTWYIYGANFEGDGAATKDAEGWVLIDAKEDIGQDRLHPVNNEPSYFGFSTETTEEYIYYKVVVTKAYSGNAIQMNELHFGTPEEFEEIKDEYQAVANEFDTEVIAEQALLDEYTAAVEAFDECANMEALFRANFALGELRDKITASVKAYTKYQNAVNDALTYLDNNALAESEALTAFVNYLGSVAIEPSEELYPNGSSAYILEEHVLADSVVIDELDFLESLKAAAVAAGYGPGMDVSSLIVNRIFKKVGESLKDENNQNIGREAEGWDGNVFRSDTDDAGDMYAAEFCNELAKFDISQTLTGLKNGFYKVTLNAGYRANGDLLSYNYAPMAYANDVKTYVPVIREFAVEDSLESWQGAVADHKVYINAPEDSTEYTWGIWGCEGSAHAFAQGRYAITLVAEVTDGNLTIGVKNEGTKGNEWTAVSNFGLVYLGETEDTAADAFAEVAEYNAARIATLTESYVATDPLDAVDGQVAYDNAPNFAAAQKAALAEQKGVATFEAEKAIGELMQSIYETKKAYVELFNAAVNVYNKWYEWAGVGEAETAVSEVWDNITAGTYADTEAAAATKGQLYTDYPDYLQVKGDKATNLDYSQDQFTFDITTTGVNPAIELTGIYEALEKDETILAFDYTAEQDIEGGDLLYETPNLTTDIIETFNVVPATSEWSTIYVNVSKGIRSLNFGTATNHSVMWRISRKVTKEDVLKLVARNFRFITRAEMQAAGGTPINGVIGDLNNDGTVDIADVVECLSAMAQDTVDLSNDVNGDGAVDIADVVEILSIMAQQ